MGGWNFFGPIASGRSIYLWPMNQELQALFAERFVRNSNRLYRYIFCLVPHRTEAEELFQETSLGLWKTWERYRPEIDFVAWACGTAHNVIRSHLRKRKNQPRLLADEGLLDQLAERRIFEDQSLEEQQLALRSCLERLPEGQRRIVEEVYGGDRSMKEIAERLSQTPNALYKLLRRIRAALFECAERKLAPRGSL
jgi:RNA polymerase sigma-70 factor (ECF subfamily)